MPAAVTIVIERHTVRVVVAAWFIPAWFIPAWFIPGSISLLAIVAADDITGDSANDRADDRSTRAAMGRGVADDAAADRANRRSCVTAALAIRGFRCDRRETERKRSQGKYRCACRSHLPDFLPYSVPQPSRGWDL
jgi:hypothetical protein